jgi:hypothetical protein
MAAIARGVNDHVVRACKKLSATLEFHRVPRGGVRRVLSFAKSRSFRPESAYTSRPTAFLSARESGAGEPMCQRTDTSSDCEPRRSPGDQRPSSESR